MIAVGGVPMVWCSGYGGGKIEIWLSGGESGQCLDDFFIAVEGGDRTVHGGWAARVVRIQYFDFGSRDETTG
jgi:hypothetical protein